MGRIRAERLMPEMGTVSVGVVRFERKVYIANPTGRESVRFESERRIPCCTAGVSCSLPIRISHSSAKGREGQTTNDLLR